MRGYRMRPIYLDYLYMVLGTGLTAFAIKCFYEPNHLIVGGFSGLGIIIKSLSKSVMAGGIPLWATNLLLNLPFFLVAWKLKGRQFIGRTTFATVMMTFWLYCIPQIQLTNENLLLAAIFGGAIHGAGMGLVFITKSTTGGTDMVGAILQYFIPQLSIAKGMMCMDGIVVLLGAFVFGVEPTLYAIMAIVVINKVADAIIAGVKDAKTVYIISDRHQEVADAILHRVDRGLTGIYAKGMFTGEDRQILFCVCSKKELIRLKEEVGSIDPHAFVIVSDAKEAMGEGFHPVE